MIIVKKIWVSHVKIILRLQWSHLVRYNRDILDIVLVDVQILAGSESVFTELRSVLGTWYCMLISMLLYTNPTVQATDLQYHAHVRTVRSHFTVLAQLTITF